MTHVAVVGAGVMGCAAAWALHEGGADVTVYEQFDLDNTRGSSHGRSRIFRLAYPDPACIRFAQEAYAGWNDLDPTLLELYGLVELAPEPSLTSARALDECGIAYTLPTEIEGVAVPSGWTAVQVGDAGIVLADRARRAFLDGIEVEANTRVESLDDVDADAVVVTAGAWVGRLVDDIDVRVTRETVAYFRSDGPPLPSVVDIGAGGGHDMYALHDPLHGLKAGAHHAGPESDPDEPAEPDPAIVERIAAWVAARFPGVDPDPVEADTCVYTTTPDHDFVLERRGRVVVGSACSGHGFKFAPAVGRRIAALALQ
ncbi:MAG: FAD-dependent oxidoreductase [Actinobacteria bacterium]|nr:FAD-dependent oxidoreductase [Actinomycetota bacterium]